MEINWSASEIIKRQQKEARRRKKQLLQQYEGMALQEAKAADDRKRLTEYHAFRQYKEEILRRGREKRREQDVGSGRDRTQEAERVSETVQREKPGAAERV